MCSPRTHDIAPDLLAVSEQTTNQIHKFDGKDYPQEGSEWGPFSTRRVDGNTYDFEVKKAGVKFHETARWVV